MLNLVRKVNKSNHNGIYFTIRLTKVWVGVGIESDGIDIKGTYEVIFKCSKTF